MAIEGDLRSLNIASVLQLIAREMLTGVLKIKKDNEIVDVGFIDGDVTGAFYEQGERVERLEAYLVRSGMIGKNLYEMIEEIHRETKRPIMNIILEDKYLNSEEVERIIKFKIQEVLDELFTWQHGSFKFDEGSLVYPKSTIKIRMHTESLILESARRIDEWPRITKAISSGDLVYKKIERPELKLTPKEDEARILSLIDERRSVADLIEISGLGKFHTYACLYHLLTAGQIAVAYAKPSSKSTRKKKFLSLKYFIFSSGVIAMFIILVTELLLGNYLYKRRVFSFDIINQQDYEESQEDYQQIFFYKYNRMPSVQEVRSIFEE